MHEIGIHNQDGNVQCHGGLRKTIQAPSVSDCCFHILSFLSKNSIWLAWCLFEKYWQKVCYGQFTNVWIYDWLYKMREAHYQTTIWSTSILIPNPITSTPAVCNFNKKLFQKVIYSNVYGYTRGSYNSAHRWWLEMDEHFYPTLYKGCNY